MKKIWGGMFSILGFVVFIFFGLWSLIVESQIVYRVIGFWGSVIAFGLFPITFAVAPWYALIIQRNWFPLVLGYGGGIAAAILFYIGRVIAPDEMQPSPTPKNSPTPKKYAEWYRVVLIILLALGIFGEVFVGNPLSLMLWFLFFTVSIIGLAMKKRWGSVLVMIYSVYDLLFILLSSSVTGNLPNQGEIVTPFVGWIMVIVLFSLPIFQFVIAIKEFKQLGSIETKGGLGK